MAAFPFLLPRDLLRPMKASSVTHISIAVSLLPRNCWCLVNANPFLISVHTPCAAPFPHVRADGGLSCALYPMSLGASSKCVSWMAITSGLFSGSNALMCCCRTALRHLKPFAFQCHTLIVLLLSILGLVITLVLLQHVRELLHHLLLELLHLLSYLLLHELRASLDDSLLHCL